MDAPNFWKQDKLGNVIELIYGKGISSSDRDAQGTVPIYGANGVLGRSNKHLVEGEALIIGRKGSAGEITRVSGKFWPSDVTYYVLGNNILNIDFLFFLLKKINLKQFASGIKPGINRNQVYQIEIPIPPYEEQTKIVKKLKELFEEINHINTSISFLQQKKQEFLQANLTTNHLKLQNEKLGKYIEESSVRIGNNWEGLRKIGVSSEEGITELRVGGKTTFETYKTVKKYSFIYNPMRINIGSIALYLDNSEAVTSPDYVVFRIKDTIPPLYLLEFLKSSSGLREIANNTQGSVRERLYFENLSNINIPILPPKDLLLIEKVLEEFYKLGLKKKNILHSVGIIQEKILKKAFTGELI